MPKLKDLRPGEYFTLRSIAEPTESQVYIRREYDRSERKFWAHSFLDYPTVSLLATTREHTTSTLRTMSMAISLLLAV